MEAGNLEQKKTITLADPALVAEYVLEAPRWRLAAARAP